MIFRVFEITDDGSLVRRGEFDTPDFIAAAELFIAQFKLVRYSKSQRGEPMGVLHMMDISNGEIHWMLEEGPHQLAVKKMEPDDVMPLDWLVRPLVDARVAELEEKIEELEDQTEELERDKDKMDRKIGELMDVIDSASSDITNARAEISNVAFPNIDDMRSELKAGMERLIDDLVTGEAPDLDDLDSTLQGIENDLDGADGSIY